MADHEDRSQRPARAGDGTLPAEKKRPDINWYGSSKRPVEEFANDHHPEVGGNPPENPGYSGNDSKKREAPVAPADVFPTGGPGAQSDG